MKKHSCRRFRLLPIILLGVLVALETGCASAPEGSAPLKQQVLTGMPSTGKAGIYLIRENGILGSGALWEVFLDGQPYGGLPLGSYFYVEVQPGEHSLDYK